MAGPDLSMILETTPPPVFVTVRTSVREAAGLMKEHHTTAVLVMDRERIAGIFTSKDVVLRVIAPGYDPSNTSVIRVMTPHPDTAKEDLSIQAALRKMHGIAIKGIQLIEQTAITSISPLLIHRIQSSELSTC
jgi:CBS domain-containing protein